MTSRTLNDLYTPGQILSNQNGKNFSLVTIIMIFLHTSLEYISLIYLLFGFDSTDFVLHFVFFFLGLFIEKIIGNWCKKSLLNLPNCRGQQEVSGERPGNGSA